MLRLVHLADPPVDTAFIMTCIVFVCMYVARTVCKTEGSSGAYTSASCQKEPVQYQQCLPMIFRVSPPSLLQCRYLIRLCMLEEAAHYQLGVSPVHSPLHCLDTQLTHPAAAAAAAAAD